MFGALLSDVEFQTAAFYEPQVDGDLLFRGVVEAAVSVIDFERDGNADRGSVHDLPQVVGVELR